ncbi:hypothetical protein JQN58_10345 [Aneurinibacillus sp. BA2021]|nr:hypothetical protein [Aneurinibacillus sp. BA2021]
MEGKPFIFFMGDSEIEGIVLGTESPYEKETQMVRYSLQEQHQAPVLTLPLHEAKTVYFFYAKYQTDRCFTEAELRGHCLRNKADYIAVRRTLGLCAAIGQKRDMPGDPELMNWMDRFVFPRLYAAVRQVVHTDSDVAFAIWSDPSSIIAEYVAEKLQPFSCRMQVFPAGFLHSASGNKIEYDNRWQTVKNAAGLFMLEKTPPFLSLPMKDWKAHQAGMAQKVLIDPYNFYEAEEMKAIGCEYIRYGYFS